MPECPVSLRDLADNYVAVFWRRVARKHGMSCSKNESGVRIAARLSSMLLEPGYFDDLLMEMDAVVGKALVIAVQAADSEGFVSSSRCKGALVPFLSGTHWVTGTGRFIDRYVSRVINEVMDYGLLFSGFRSNHYLVPSELLDILRRGKTPDAVMPDENSQWSKSFTLTPDIVRFVAEWHRKPPKLKADDKLPAAWSNRLMKTFSGEANPDRLEFIYAYCESKDLFSPSNLSKWLEYADEQVMKDYRELALYWKGENSLIEHIENILRSSPSGAAYRLHELLESAGGPNSQEWLHRYLIAPLLWTGCLETSGDLVRLTPEGRALFQDTETPHAIIETEFWVQPNFEVIVPENLDFALRWDVECLCEPVKPGPCYVYGLTRKSVLRALRNGWKPQRITGFLKGASKGDVSDNVLKTLAEWTSQFARVQMGLVCLLETDDEPLLMELSHLSGVKPHLLKRVSPCALALKAENLSDIVRYLEEKGYMPCVWTETRSEE